MEVAIIILGFFQLILLVKLWQMTNDVQVIKEKFIFFTSRGFTENRRIELINNSVYKRLREWYKIRKGKNESKVSKNVISAIDDDVKFIQNLIHEYGANDFYTIDLIKESMIKAFTIK